MKKRIDPKFKLPCDFVVGHLRFRKGVKLETVRAAADRWLKIAARNETISAGAKYDLKAMVEQITDANRH